MTTLEIILLICFFVNIILNIPLMKLIIIDVRHLEKMQYHYLNLFQMADDRFEKIERRINDQ